MAAHALKPWLCAAFCRDSSRDPPKRKVFQYVLRGGDDAETAVPAGAGRGFDGGLDVPGERRQEVHEALGEEAGVDGLHADLLPVGLIG